MNFGGNYMNEFKKSYRKFTIKTLDEKIQQTIKTRLNKLEKSTDIEEYQKHISSRKDGILSILNNFDFFINIIERKNEFSVPNKSKKISDYNDALDKILSRIIAEELDLLYKNMSSENLSNNDIIYIQIFDRKKKISELLENYDDNMNYLDTYIKQEENSKQSQLLH